MINDHVGLRRSALITMGSAGLAVGFLAAAGPAAAEPTCPNNTVIVQGQELPQPATGVCDDDTRDDGILGGLPVVDNLPGVGGVL